MFGLGYFEILILLLLAVIFVKPEDLPELLRKLGKLIGMVRKMVWEAQSQLDELKRMHEPIGPAQNGHVRDDAGSSGAMGKEVKESSKKNPPIPPTEEN
ncbi:MAG: hypothetical protein HQL31_08325 [Planctomycetes bacterium]|nr:hypothetical protein [Planctomycetota bacterium]